MKQSKLLTITVVALAFSIVQVNQTAFSKEATRPSVAVVNIQQIVQSSPEINALNADRKSKVNSLVSYVEKARTEISKETNATKKKTLEENYTKEINTRKEALDKEYIQNLANVDKQISALIKSKASGYDLVLTKSSVLDGGTDITNDIIKELK